MNLREEAEDFISMLTAEVNAKCPAIQCMLIFGSYTRSDIFNDIDIIPVLAADTQDAQHLVGLSQADRRHFEWVLSHHTSWKIPPLSIHHYSHVLGHNPRHMYDEIQQLEGQVREFYDFYAGFNSLDSYTRAEFEITSPPRSFLISPEHSVFFHTSKRPHGTIFECSAKEMLRALNSEYAPKVAAYAQGVSSL